MFKIESVKNTAEIGTKNVEKNLFIKNAEEIDNGMLMLRERIYGENGILTHDDKEFETQSTLVQNAF